MIRKTFVMLGIICLLAPIAELDFFIALSKSGADAFDDLDGVAEGFERIKDDNILRGMTAISPVMKLFAWMPVAKRITQKILVFEKK